MGEEPAYVAQEGPFGLYSPELLEDRQGEDLGVRELLEGLLELAFGVEEPVGVVDEAEQDGYGLLLFSC